MGIIAILAAMLMPALQRAREAANRTSCLNNLKQIGAGLAMYRKDHDAVPEYSNFISRRHSPDPWNKGGDGSRPGNYSWDDLWPGYIGSAGLYWCPSDSADQKPEAKYNIGNLEELPDGTYTHHKWCGDSSDAWCYDWDDYSAKSWANLNNDPEARRVARKFGIGSADDISYAYVGNENLSKVEKSTAADLRVAGDNEMEGDEEPCGCASSNIGGCGRDMRTIRNFRAGVVPPGYRYAGGLEAQDNHAQDGVNVLYYDWHGGFDGRSWPSPLGALETENWNKCQWQGDACPCCDGPVAHWWGGGRDTNWGDASAMWSEINLTESDGSTTCDSYQAQ
jgi:type II secretory pathway pseudopilin PulG